MSVGILSSIHTCFGGSLGHSPGPRVSQHGWEPRPVCLQFPSHRLKFCAFGGRDLTLSSRVWQQHLDCSGTLASGIEMFWILSLPRNPRCVWFPLTLFS